MRLTVRLQLVQMFLTQPPTYTLQLSLTETLHFRCSHRYFRRVSSVVTPHSELARTNIVVDRAAILFFVRVSRFKTSTRTSAILVDFLDVLEMFQENSGH